MQSTHKPKHRLLSFMLALIMIFSLIPINTAFAGDTDIGSGGISDSGGAVSDNNKIVNGEEFIRVSVFWAPLDGDDLTKADWTSGDVKQIGTSVDIYAPGHGPGNWGPVKLYGNFNKGGETSFNTARYYQHEKSRVVTLDNYGNYLYDSNAYAMSDVPAGSREEAEKSGRTVSFPVLLDKNTDQKSIEAYFKDNWYVYNDILFRAQASKAGLNTSEESKTAGSTPGWQQVVNMERGWYENEKGEFEQGQFIFLLEDGIYCKANGQSAALTMREAYHLDGINKFLSAVATPIMNLANRLYVSKDWPMLGLKGLQEQGFQIPNKNSLRSKQGIALDKLGAGVVEFPVGKKTGLPAINYYYDIELSDLTVNPDGTVSVNKDALERKANNSKRVDTMGNTYTAPSIDSPNGSTEKYTLIKGYITNKDVVEGYIDIQDPTGLGFYNIMNDLRISHKLADYIAKKDKIDNTGDAYFNELVKGYETTDMQNQPGEKLIKTWAFSEKLSCEIIENAKIAGSATQHIKVTTTNELKVDLGKDDGKLQPVFLYVKLPSEYPSPYSLEWPVPDNPSFDEKTIGGGTNVTKMYVDIDPTTKEEKVVKITSETINKESTYDIPSKDGDYTMTEWVKVDDITKEKPEAYPDWTTVKGNESTGHNPAGDSPNSGTTAGSLGPTNWNDPDRELFIKYTKEPLTPEILPSELYLPERRISWHKSLIDLNGGTVPTITFKWAAITGHETHYDGCGSEDSPCPGHPCNESIGSDNFFRFVASNLTAVKSDIMGNKTNFMPYDKDNVYETTRGNSEGTYEMHPDYGFVIWRGKDIPTIASYKYGDTTGSGTATSAPIIKNLIGETQAGISGKGARNPNNNGSYTDSFSINEGKSNYDTGNMTGFIGSFGGDRGTADGVYEGKINDFHTVSTQLKADIKALSEAESQLAAAKAELDAAESALNTAHSRHRSGSHKIGFTDPPISSCSTCSAAQRVYDAALAKYNRAKVVRDAAQVQKDATEASYNSIGALIGRKETGSAAVIKNSGDYDYSTSWSWCGRESWYNATGDSKTFAPDTRVDVGYGTAGVGNEKVTFKSSNLNAFGKEYTNVTGFPINNTKNMEFWPYVEMVYDTSTAARDQKVYVLGGHKSTMVPQDYVEIGYLPVAANSETSTGLLMQSQQWSTHQAATTLAGGVKNKVLPGGAIYRLTTPGAGTGSSKATTIAVSSWLTFFPNDTINATVAGKDVYNGASQNTKNEALYRQVLNSLNSLDVLQIVNNTQVLQEKAGSQKVTGTSNQPTSKDTKYWLTQNIKDGTGNSGVPASDAAATKISSVKPNEAELDITNSKEERIYYRIYSDTAGNVYVSKSTASADATKPGSGGIIAQINKTQGLNDLLKTTEVKALNNRTNVVSNYLASIDRNIGADQELIATGKDGKWYNEAFDGICVVRINKQIEVGFKDSNASQAARTAAIDPKLTPVRKSQSDLFKSKATSWFETDNHTNLSNEAGYVGTFSSPGTGAPDTKITIQNMNGIYKSKVFFIPNVSVQDLY